MPAFSLTDWITWWKDIEFNFSAVELSPFSMTIVKVGKIEHQGYLVPLSEKLEDTIADFREGSEKEDIETVQRILGKSYGVVQGGSPTYWMLSVMREYHFMTPEIWSDLSLKERAMYIAALQTQQDIALYQRFIEQAK